MPPPFKQISRHEFAGALDNYPWRQPKSEIHVHHTWRPNHAQYTGERSINGMYRYHTQTSGFSDIAQHISIAPDGSIWTGRSWNKSPASARGHNHRGVFMFETIGDFDIGQDPLAGEQLETVVFVIASIQIFFGLPLWYSVKFHNQMSSKSCPGTSVERATLIGQVRDKREEIEGEMLTGVRAFDAWDEGEKEEFLGTIGTEQDPERAGDEGEVEHGKKLEDFMIEVFESKGS